MYHIAYTHTFACMYVPVYVYVYSYVHTHTHTHIHVEKTKATRELVVVLLTNMKFVREKSTDARETRHGPPKYGVARSVDSKNGEVSFAQNWKESTRWFVLEHEACCASLLRDFIKLLRDLSRTVWYISFVIRRIILGRTWGVERDAVAQFVTLLRKLSRTAWFIWSVTRDALYCDFSCCCSICHELYGTCRRWHQRHTLYGPTRGR